MFSTRCSYVQYKFSLIIHENIAHKIIMVFKLRYAGMNSYVVHEFMIQRSIQIGDNEFNNLIWQLK